MDILSRWSGPIQLVSVALFGVAFLWLRSQFVSRSEFLDAAKAIGERATAQSERLTRGDAKFDLLAQKFETIPSRQQLTELALGLERVTGEIRVQGAQLAGAMQIMERVEASVTRHETIFSDAARR
ncbi:hypothetical protein [Zavarzinia compransoris]|nr:hypothetical protein [Zavarzinia compransoris]